jgi:hypothetical protein
MRTQEQTEARRRYMKEYRKKYRQSEAGRKFIQQGHARYRLTEKRRICIAKYELAHRNEKLARSAVNNAVANGRLVQEPCFICGEKGEAHHASYAEDMRLLITWLCRKHHREIHNKRKLQ